MGKEIAKILVSIVLGFVLCWFMRKEEEIPIPIIAQKSENIIKADSLIKEIIVYKERIVARKEYIHKFKERARNEIINLDSLSLLVHYNIWAGYKGQLNDSVKHGTAGGLYK